MIPRDYQTELARLQRRMIILIALVIGGYSTFVWGAARDQLWPVFVGALVTTVTAVVIFRLFRRAERTVGDAERARSW